ncbi:hypothetical protein DFQ28_005878 [Apophysomyces sp. BC1034]|nr:hypothetical protein DFQ30_003961 [Apophysomyces sp. BC1015]KAG0181671.1 hypothetical protein DFQ29_007547 [Apophysomyces sp. BC1021]KAG0193260.1 hypothetical protein DFQ28_005878 [Apophysomyces sp. BC1034]
MDSISQAACITLISAASSLALLSWKYNDRGVFDDYRQGCVHRPGLPLIGSLPSILKNRQTLLDWHLEAFDKTDALTMSVSGSTIPMSIITIDPRNIEHFLKTNFENYAKGPRFRLATADLLGNGIFTADGEHWRWQRKTASHIFYVRNFRDHFTDAFVKEINLMCAQIFDNAIDQGTPVDFHAAMHKFTLESFVLIGFGTQLNAIAQENVPFAVSFDELQKHAVNVLVNPFAPLQVLADRVFQPSKPTVEQHLDTINNFAYSVIEQRREGLAQGKEYQDLLSRFMQAKNAEGNPLSDQELRDTVLNFIIAGRDTTAQALSWAFYALITHPHVEKALLEEIEKHDVDSVEHDSPALYETIKQMTYAHAVFYEVLRLYPSVPSNLKYALKDDIWPDGTHVKKGDYIMWLSYVQGRSEKIWGHDARQFRPERWITPDGELRRESQAQWSVFHAGPRVCLGQQLATLEALVAIIFLLRRYRFSLVPNQTITYQTTMTMPMKYGMKVYIEKRHPSS